MYDPATIAAAIAREEIYREECRARQLDFAHIQAIDAEIRRYQRKLRPVRVILKCKRCKSVRAYDYLNQPDYERLDADGVVHSLQSDSTCPTCGRWTDAAFVKGVISEHTCDARCMGATGPHCECSCGGKNHGGRYLA